MDIKNIVLHIAQDSRVEARTGVAIAVAKAHEAHLTAIYAVPGQPMPTYLATYIPEDLLAQQQRQVDEAAEAAKAAFLERAEREEVSAEWRLGRGDPRDVMALSARYADLVIVGQSDRDAVSTVGYDLAEELVLTAGRPILVIPYAGRFNGVGKTVLVAWNGTREASRAVHDALPILERSDKVIVFSVNPPDSDHIPGAEISAHLARHGVTAEAHYTVAHDIEVGDALLAALSDHGADLMVMGAYGHSRMREIAFGGATRDLLHHMTAPVLMAN